MYQSTRGSSRASLSEAVLRGLAPDGGLFVPSEPLRCNAGLELLRRAEPSSFGDTARSCAEEVIPGLDGPVAREVAEAAITFDVPLRRLEENRYVLELFHGPTHAFKDVGARFMAAMVGRFEHASESDLTVLVATSGDTGGAVANAFDGIDGVRVVLLFPETGVTLVQRRQMTTLGENVTAVAVRGSFDDCQRLVKEAFVNETVRETITLTSANSINVGRLLPQSLYYWHAARALRPHTNDLPVFVVPSGNLGNLCSGLFAKTAGLPCRGFVAACNENHGFVDFLEGEPFEARASLATRSNAMDVGAPSNLERIRWLYGGDDRLLRGDVRGVWAMDEEMLATIRSVYERTGYILDPHSAVAYAAAERVGVSDAPMVVLATAHPAKFSSVVQEALGREPEPAPGLVFPEHVEERVTSIDAGNSSLTRLLLEGNVA